MTYLKHGTEPEPENRTEHIGVMVKPQTRDKLENVKSARRGREASVSAVSNDIIEYFFANYGEDVSQIETVLRRHKSEPAA